ncbi:MAG: response regulator [Burkholderiaceae bacterium]
MNDPDTKSAPILIASGKAGDANLLKELLQSEFGNIHTSTVAQLAVADFAQHAPQVLMLAFDKLEKAEAYLLTLFQEGQNIQLHPCRTIVLCHKDEVRNAYTLCRRGTFDDYVLFWPLTTDSARLAMSVHIALREFAAQRDAARSAAECADQTRQMADMGTRLETSLEQGNQHLESASEALAQAETRIGAAFDGLSDRLTRGDLSLMVAVKDAARLSAALARIKTEEIARPLDSAARSTVSLFRWIAEFRQELQPHREVVRSLAALVEPVEPVILVVDDDGFQRELMRTVLSTQNYRTVLAASGAEALKSLRNTRIDLVLMDMMMPGMDGLQTTMQIKADPQYVQLPIIMATGRSDGNVVLDSLKAGAVDFIVKPIKPAALLAKMARALRAASHPATAAEPPQ